jgi:polygalacturonase
MKKQLMKPTTKNQHHVPGKVIAVVAVLLSACVCVRANPTLPSIPSGTYNITSYGASTSSANNATAIQDAINAASAAGGGTVQIPSGTFLSGPLTLKSKINLNLASGATLRMLAYGTYPGSTSFIVANTLNNIEISGSGTIDGQGSAWWSAYNSNKSLARPQMIVIESCTDVEITGVTLLNSPNVHLSMPYSNNQVTISGITITAPSNSPNTDGIDPEGSNYLIENCTIDNGDDNIAIGASHNASGYITIQNCNFGTGHGCSIGSYTTYGVSFVYVNNCTFNGTTSGIRMKSEQGRGGTVQYIYYSGLTMNNVENPIWIDSLYPDNPDPSNPTQDPSGSVTSTTPIWKHFGISNTKISGSSNAGTINGLPYESVGTVGITNVQISATTGMKIYYAGPVTFTGGSTVSVSSGNAVTIYDATVTGISTTEY